MARLIRGLGSLAVLLLGIAGVPLALAFLGGNPLPHELSWSAMREALFAPVDGVVLVGLITIIGWLAWLAFTLSVISELVALVSRQRVRIRLPGLEAPHRFTAGLLISVITKIAPQEPGPLIVEPSEALTPQAAAAPRAERVDDDGHHHVVQSGDDLWSLAERYYGNGRDWRKIAAANPTVLTGGPDRLQIGWRLKIPDLDDDSRHGHQRMITVRRGDSLSAIAERELGAASRWIDIFRANRSQLTDPDELVLGMRLALPKQKRSEATATAKGDDRHRHGEDSHQRHHQSASPVEPSASSTPPPTEPSGPPSQAAPADEVPTSAAP